MRKSEGHEGYPFYNLLSFPPLYHHPYHSIHSHPFIYHRTLQKLISLPLKDYIDEQVTSEVILLLHAFDKLSILFYDQQRNSTFFLLYSQFVSVILLMMSEQNSL